jgi:hypothetical protein
MLLTIHNYYSKVIQSLRHDKTALVRVFDSRPFRVRVRIATWTSGRAAIHLALAPEADSFMPLRRARWDRVFEGPIVSTFKTIVGSFLDPSRAGGSVTVRFSTHRIKNADFRVYVDPGYQHARSQIRINLIWSISAFSNSSLRAESGLGLSSNAWERE